MAIGLRQQPFEKRLVILEHRGRGRGSPLQVADLWRLADDVVDASLIERDRTAVLTDRRFQNQCGGWLRLSLAAATILGIWPMRAPALRMLTLAASIA